MRYLLLAALTALSLNAYANDLSLIVHTWTVHAKDNSSFNSNTHGVGLSIQEDKWGFNIGALKNSYSKTGAYATVERELRSWGPLDVSVGAGAISGYDNPVSDKLGGLSPMVYMNLEFNANSNVNPVITIIPPAYGPAAVLLSFKVSF